MNDSISAGLIVGVVAGLVSAVLQGLQRDYHAYSCSHLSLYVSCPQQCNAYPALKEWQGSSLTPEGRKLYSKASESCFGGFMFASFLRDVLGPTYFRQERPLEDPLPRKILDRLNLDRPEVAIPSQPMFVLGSLHDEVVPTSDLDNFVNNWSKRGANIEYTRDRLSKHVTLCFTGFSATLHWLQKRFDGEETHSKPGEAYVRTVDTTLWLDDDDADQASCPEVKPASQGDAVTVARVSDDPKTIGESGVEETSGTSGKADIECSLLSLSYTVPMLRRRQLRQTLAAFKDKVYFY